MKRDAFSCLHPAVNFIFFIGALGFGVVILHPVYLIAGLVCAFSYYLLLHGTQGLKRIVLMSPLFLVVILLNGLSVQNSNHWQVIIKFAFVADRNAFVDAYLVSGTENVYKAES